jgi:hypothetical protein
MCFANKGQRNKEIVNLLAHSGVPSIYTDDRLLVLVPKTKAYKE